MHQRPDVVTGAANHPAHGQEIAPDRNRVVGVLAKATDGEPAALPDLGHHERQVQEPIDSVVADQQRAVSGQVLDAVELRLRDTAEGVEQRDDAIDRGLGGQRGNIGRWLGHCTRAWRYLTLI